MSNKKKIGLIAHDYKKKELADWALKHKEELRRHDLFATGTTGKLLEETLQLPVTRLQSGPLGGDQQIGAMIVEGNIDLLIFFWDPMESQPHDPDVKALIRIGVVWNIPIACDTATADFIIHSPLMQQEYKRALPDYTSYKNRKV